jgi:hypothetical protein
MAIDPKIIERVRNLMSRRDHSSTPEAEAQNAAAMISRLLIEHGLSEESVVTTDEDKKVVSKNATMGVKRGQNFEWVIILAHAVGEACLCEVLMTPETRTVIFIGRPTDVAVASETYAWLSECLVHLSFRATYGIPMPKEGEPFKYVRTKMGTEFACPKDWGWHKCNRPDQGGTQYRRSFIFGCAQRVAERLIAERAKQVDELGSQVTALVAVRGEENKEYIAKTWPKLSKFKTGGRKLDADAYYHGRKEGDKVQLRPSKKIDAAA